MKNSTKKWLTAAGGLALCAILVYAIANQLYQEPARDNPLPASNSQPGDVTVPGTDIPKEDVVQPQIPESIPDAETGGGAMSSGTEQTIQGDVVKPEPDGDDIKDPTQKPDGTPVEGTPEPEDHDNVTPPPPPPSTNTSGGLPGFDNVPDLGENQVIYADDMYENGNKIGIMD